MKNILNALIGLVGLLSIPFTVCAQYTVTPFAPPPRFGFEDLWHFTLSKSTADKYTQYYVSIRVFNETNALKLKSNSAFFALPVGSRYYNRSNLAELQPFATSYYDASLLQQAVSVGGSFPPGTYQIAYTLFGKTADGEFVPLAEDALQVLVDALWPPMLLYPPDGDTIDSPVPVLSWTPAFSSQITSPITYSLHLKKLFAGQNAYQAMQANPDYFTQSNIPVTALPYPPGAQTLDTGEVYTWQVHADVNGQSLGSSEIWTFTLATPKAPAQKPVPGYYFKPAEKIPAEFVRLSEAFLPIALDERYHPVTAPAFSFTIYNEKMAPVGSDKDFGAPIQAGFNRYLIPVCGSEGKISLPVGRYFLEIHLEKKVTHYLAFEIKEKHCHDQ